MVTYKIWQLLCLPKSVVVKLKLPGTKMALMTWSSSREKTRAAMPMQRHRMKINKGF